MIFLFTNGWSCYEGKLTIAVYTLIFMRFNMTYNTRYNVLIKCCIFLQHLGNFDV